MRIGGLASGMDIDSIVIDLMKAERIPLNKLKQKKQTLEWQREDFRSINTLLLNFRTELTKVKLSSTFRARGTTSTDETKVTATATSSASLSSFAISEVKRLASAATKVNTEAISKSGGKVDLNKSLYEGRNDFANSNFDWKVGSVLSQRLEVIGGEPIKLSLSGGAKVDTNGPINVNVNGVSYEVVSETSVPVPGQKQVKIDVDGNLTFSDPIASGSTIKVDYIASLSVQNSTISDDTATLSLSDRASVSSSKLNTIKVTSSNGTVKSYTVGTDNSISDGTTIVGTVEDGQIKMSFSKGDVVEVGYTEQYSSFSIKTFGPNGKINKEKFSFSGADNLNNVISRVNASTVGVTMFYDSVKDQMTLTRKETGNFNGSSPLDGGTATIDHEIVTDGNLINDVLKFRDASETGGENAKFIINGLDTERTTNNFEISGVTLSLKKTFSDSPVSINVNNNTDQIFNNIKGFIEKYNEMIAKIQGELSENRYKTYTPLTDDQRESLSDKQQEQWEEKARSGMLRRDPTLTNILTKMRSDFYNPVGNEGVNPLFKQLASIGINTSSNYLEGGKLEINEAELRKAIENDPISVEKLFNATGTTEVQKGIAHRLTDTVNNGLDKLRIKAGNAFTTSNQYEIGKQLLDIDNRITRYERRMTKVENRYWSQFTAMEKAIQRSNEQMSQILNYSG